MSVVVAFTSISGVMYPHWLGAHLVQDKLFWLVTQFFPLKYCVMHINCEKLIFLPSLQFQNVQFWAWF